MFSVLSRRCLSQQSSAIQNLVIFGGGLMGSGIAQVAAHNAHNVILVDQSSSILNGARTRIEQSVQKLSKKQSELEPKVFVESILSKISTQVFDPSSMKSFEMDDKTDLIIEAIVENLEAKHKLFHVLDESAPEGTIFTSNTSSLPITEIFKHTKRQDRVGGLHFFNPVPMMKLLEVVRGQHTSDATFEQLCSFGANMNKMIVKCKDTPGFIVNRLLVPYLSEAMKLLERGDAEMKDIDVAMKLGAGHPMGPFELSDYVGLDTIASILQGWHEKYPDNESFVVPPILRKLVDEGKLGKKSGQGFYDYSKK